MGANVDTGQGTKVGASSGNMCEPLPGCRPRTPFAGSSTPTCRPPVHCGDWQPRPGIQLKPAETGTAGLSWCCAPELTVAPENSARRPWQTSVPAPAAATPHPLCQADSPARLESGLRSRVWSGNRAIGKGRRVGLCCERDPVRRSLLWCTSRERRSCRARSKFPCQARKFCWCFGVSSLGSWDLARVDRCWFAG